MRMVATKGKQEASSHLPRQRDLVHFRNWDLLVILDACRFDYFQRIYREYLSGRLEEAYSEGIDTFEFLKEVFPSYYELTYISGAVPVNSFIKPNPQGLGHLYRGYTPRKHFKRIVDVWYSDWDDSLGTTPPDKVVDAAIGNLDSKMIVHIFQPHAPFIGEPKLLGWTGDKVGKGRGVPPDAPIWQGLQGVPEVWCGADTDFLRKAHEGNLRLALSEVKRLLESIGDRFNRIVVTSDHGEALGEDGVFAHSKDHPVIRRIPWLEVDNPSRQC